METYFDSRVDLLQRKLQKHSDRLKMKAEETFKIKDLKIKDLSGDLLTENLEKEVKAFKLKVRIYAAPVLQWLTVAQISTRMTSLAASWQSAKVVRTREKVSFFLGVMNLLFTALIFGMAPQCVVLIHRLTPQSLTRHDVQMGTHFVHRPGSLSPPLALLSIQEARLALLFVRPLLLYHHSQLYFLLDFAFKYLALGRLLLSIARVSRQRGDYLAEQSCLP